MVGGELKWGNSEARLRVFWATVKTLVFALSGWEPWEGCEQRRDVPDIGSSRILLVTVRTGCGDEGRNREVLWGLRKVCSDCNAPPQLHPSAEILSNHHYYPPFPHTGRRALKGNPHRKMEHW